MISTGILTHLVELTGNVADAFTTALYTADLENRTLKLREHLTLSSHFDPEAVISFDQGPVGRAAANRKPVVIDHFAPSAEPLKFYKKKEDLKSLMAVPVLYEDLEGVLIVDAKESYSFSPKLQKIILGFAEQMAWHLHQERQPPLLGPDSAPAAEEETPSHRFRAATPDRTAVAEFLIGIPPSVLHCDAVAVVWFPVNGGPGAIGNQRGFERGLSAVRSVPEKSVVGSCAQIRAPLLVKSRGRSHTVFFAEPERLDGFQALAAVPIAVEGVLFGVLVCASHRAEGLTDRDLDTLTLVASSAAATLLCGNDPAAREKDPEMDPVTGLPNQRFLFERYPAIEEEVLQSRKPVFVLTAQITNLGSLCEKLGTGPTDELLRKIAFLFARVIPAPKYIFRYSETTFLIIMMDKRPAKVLALETRLKQLLKNHPFRLGNRLVKVQAQWGRSSYPDDGRNLVCLAGASLTRSYNS